VHGGKTRSGLLILCAYSISIPYIGGHSPCIWCSERRMAAHKVVTDYKLHLKVLCSILDFVSSTHVWQASNLWPKSDIGVRRGVSKTVEDGRRPPTRPPAGRRRVRQGGPGQTIGSPLPPLAIRPREKPISRCPTATGTSFLILAYLQFHWHLLFPAASCFKSSSAQSSLLSIKLRRILVLANCFVLNLIYVVLRVSSH